MHSCLAIVQSLLLLLSLMLAAIVGMSLWSMELGEKVHDPKRSWVSSVRGLSSVGKAVVLSGAVAAGRSLVAMMVWPAGMRSMVFLLVLRVEAPFD